MRCRRCEARPRCGRGGFIVQAQACSLGSLTFVVPEPATWGLMIVGFGVVGVAARGRRPAFAG